MTQTRVVRRIRASPEAVYRALIDADAVAAWRVPDGMSALVREFDARVGGRFRVSLTYASPQRRGKTAAATDTYHGRFVELVPGERVVEELEFETADPAFGGAMRIVTTLSDADGGAEVVMLHQGVPAGISPHDNELGTRMALDKLAALVESRSAATS
ncbi:polyketide cyclase [Mycobacterium sp. 852002-50816_SCH5313054-b]|uniref:SRPBCC domain-containing protein n=1 Tax=Mycobacterium sp. 852002-50816_SCH5313054-b TaxID=1834092 RepID=UPI0007FCD60D|nr:SRPBCC domain-containing protein [Mycobacterium sp. 852002-50816_SCH5313054-b]OBF59332.1 polyketide cyclase [Mycobacterium sp. 852002-50816_SCH5313054-b]